MSRVLETVLTGRNLLSPVLAQAGRDVVAFNSTVAGANTKASVSATTSAAVQETASTRVVQSNTRASTSATTSSNTQARAHARAAESATLSARVQESANTALARSNGLLGTSLTPLTAGLGAVGLGLAYAGYRGMEFGTAMSQVQAASQASAADMGRLRDAAVQAGADTQYSAVEAAQGITEMSKAGVQADDILRGGLAGALNLAAAGQISVAEAAETGATALSVFRLEGNQMAHVADLLAAGAGKAQGSVGDMSAALNQSALVASQTGLSIEDTAGALAMFAHNGLIGSDAGTSFKTMLQALTPNSEAASKAMDAIGFSAYDAQGQFVGMESVADQLRTGLAGLTEEQRNSTLETIFGSDAVRAASVLYKEGAGGVAEWARNVDDAGYAQRQAAQLTDNLRGDLERLGGAVDSVFTTIGSGAQGPLREAVQALTAIVNAGGDVLGFFNDLPGPIQAGILALAGVAALKGPVSGALDRISAAVLGWSLANDGAVASTGRFRAGAAGLLGFFGGPWGLAITGATVGLSLLTSWLGKSGDGAEDAAASQTTLKQAIQATNGAIDESVRRAAAKALQDEGLLKFTELYGVSSQDMVGYVLGEAAAHDRVTGSLQRYRNQLESKLTGDKDADIVTRSLIGGVDQHIEALDGLAGSTESTVAKERELAEATGAVGGATGGAATRTATFTEQLEANKAAADGAKQAIDNFKLSLDILTGATVTMGEAEAAFYAAVDAATGAVDGLNGSVLNAAGGLNTQSEAGRAAQEVLYGVRDSGNQLIATMIQQGATAEEAAKADADLRASFIKSAGQMGISGQAAETLADHILGIPSERKTTIDADTAAATQKVLILQGQIAALKDRTVSIYTRHIQVYEQQAGRTYFGQVPEFADGGWTGPGSKYTPAGIVHADEFVVPKDRVNALGGPNRVGALVGMPGYADGGPVAAPGYGASTAAAAMPGYGMANGWGGAAAARPIVVSLAGATVTGRFEFGSDGLVTLVDGRIDGKLDEIHDVIHYAGG